MISETNDILSPYSYIAEFSLPPYFFDKDFLDNADLCKPHPHERMQPDYDLLRKQTGLMATPQEYRCHLPARVTVPQ